MIKSKFLRELEEDNRRRPYGLFFTGAAEEKQYIRENGCTYVKGYGYGGAYVRVRDKKTKEILKFPLIEY